MTVAMDKPKHRRVVLKSNGSRNKVTPSDEHNRSYEDLLPRTHFDGLHGDALPCLTWQPNDVLLSSTPGRSASSNTTPRRPHTVQTSAWERRASSSSSGNSDEVFVPRMASRSRRRAGLGTQKGRLRSRGEPVLDTRLSAKEAVRIFTATWNMHEERELPASLDDMLLPTSHPLASDIYVIGTQESTPSRKEWEVLIQQTLGPNYVMVSSSSLGVIYLIFFLRKDLLWFCSAVYTESYATRIVSAIKTKGGVGLCFTLFGSSFLFVTSHLTAHQGKVPERNSDVQRIMTNLTFFEGKDGTKFVTEGSVDTGDTTRPVYAMFTAELSPSNNVDGYHTSFDREVYVKAHRQRKSVAELTALLQQEETDGGNSPPVAYPANRHVTSSEEADLPFEEEILRHPYQLKCWMRYLEHKGKGSKTVLNLIYERALKELPGSYKLWYNYLKHRRQQVRESCISDPGYEEVNNAFERALVFLHKIAQIWIGLLPVP
eukprot:Em0484g8a